MSSREEILAAIRANRPKVERPLLTVPLFDADRPTSLLAAFKESFERMGGMFLDPPPAGDVLVPGQANNFYIFPAIGLATYAARPRRLTDACFIAAAQASADQVGPDLRAKGMLFPSQANILETEVTTATRVAEFMFDQGLAQAERPRDVRSWIERQLYRPQY
jgi:malate dehydrogenase (oxaloacetate-decarboxylating)(NADP+)